MKYTVYEYLMFAGIAIVCLGGAAMQGKAADDYNQYRSEHAADLDEGAQR